MSWLFVWFFIFLLLTLLWTWIFSKFKNPVLDLFILWHYSLQRYSLHLSSFDTRFVILAYSCLFHAFCDDSMRFALLVVCNICMYIYIFMCTSQIINSPSYSLTFSAPKRPRVAPSRSPRSGSPWTTRDKWALYTQSKGENTQAPFLDDMVDGFVSFRCPIKSSEKNLQLQNKQSWLFMCI